jgi:hypothetical protein
MTIRVAGALAIVTLGTWYVFSRQDETSEIRNADTRAMAPTVSERAIGAVRYDSRASTSSGSKPLSKVSADGEIDESPPRAAENDLSAFKTLNPGRSPSRGGNTEARSSVGRASLGNSSDLVERPFPVSASVETECKVLNEGGSDSFCYDMHKYLAVFARESRDEEWAAATERKFRDYLLAHNSEEPTIRALECRTSVCVVECVSRDHTLCFLGYEFMADSRLLPKGSGRGYEVSVSGERLVVSLDTYMRRDPM